MPLRAAFLTPLALAAALACSPAFAGFKAILGDTTNSDTFNRPVDGLESLSDVGTDVRYDTFSFSVTASGLYTLTSRGLGGWDNFLVLYEGGFDPANALTNAIATADDWLGKANVAKLSLDLDVGNVYTLVTTSFYNEDGGRYLNVFKGVGEITSPVPEPAPAAMLLAGIAMLGWIARSRRA